ncbi:MAG TPA: thioesterase [Saprospirales bacterium]|nr:thioesterase [Saprospirales bacterium]HRQ29250.1 thioesterase family protein [Saprospiraceae bacterium]
MYKHEYKVIVRYAETDQMGFVYYGNYAKFYEIGRVELIRSLGLSYKEFEDRLNIFLPVVQLESRYLLPARYDDELRIESILDELPDKMISFRHLIYNPQNFLINRGVVKLLFIDKMTGRKVSAPQEMTDLLKQHFE